jgi:hypothetical protein
MCLTPTLVCRSPSNKPSSSDKPSSSNKPSLTIDTNPNETGNRGLDKEGEWRKSAGICDHSSVSYLIGSTADGSTDIPCDFSSDFEEAGKSTRDKEIYPDKHPAFKQDGDFAYLCNNCLGVICKDCRVEYSSDEEDTPTPTQMTFPELPQNDPSSSTSNDPSSSTSNNPSSSTDNSSSSNTDNEEISKNDSLLDDYADTSTEMPDYIGGDD